MKKVFILIVSLVVIFSVSCSDNNTNHNRQENIDLSLVGTWQIVGGNQFNCLYLVFNANMTVLEYHCNDLGEAQFIRSYHWSTQNNSVCFKDNDNDSYYEYFIEDGILSLWGANFIKIGKFPE
jgi:hypothetical protein